DMIRDRPLSREPTQIAEVVQGAASSLRWPSGIRFSKDGLSDLPPVAADPGQLRQVLVNLLENAIQASSPQGDVRVVGIRDGSEIGFAVEDSGPGVDPSIRGRLFEPLVSTKNKGIGLGLALVKRIVERHGGSIAYQTRSSGGARFAVRLPLQSV